MGVVPIRKLSFLLILVFSLSVFAFAADEEWNYDADYIKSLFESGKISEDTYNLYLEGVDISAALSALEDPSSSASPDLLIATDNLPLEEASKVDLQLDSSDASLKSLSPVPTSGSAYSNPRLVEVEYVPDAEDGTLLAALYSFLGKPVQAYHYSWQSSTQGYNVYSCQVLDYDINWIASVVLLLAVLVCIMKAGGALLSKR